MGPTDQPAGGGWPLDPKGRVANACDAPHSCECDAPLSRDASPLRMTRHTITSLLACAVASRRGRRSAALACLAIDAYADNHAFAFGTVRFTIMSAAVAGSVTG